MLIKNMVEDFIAQQIQSSNNLESVLRGLSAFGFVAASTLNPLANLMSAQIVVAELCLGLDFQAVPCP